MLGAVGAGSVNSLLKFLGNLFCLGLRTRVYSGFSQNFAYVPHTVARRSGNLSVACNHKLAAINCGIEIIRAFRRVRHLKTIAVVADLRQSDI